MSFTIGVVGFLGSGKGTVGEYLVKQYGFTQDSYANPLKDTVSAVFCWPRHLLEGNTAESRAWLEVPDTWWEEKLNWKEKQYSVKHPRFTPRVCLQLFGTEVLRAGFDDSIWINSLQRRLKDVSVNTVITDCRFMNELETIKSSGGLVIRVRRGPEPEWYECAEAANSITFLHCNECYDAMLKEPVHISEWAWVGYNFDHVIDNDGSIEDLYRSVDSYMKGIQ